MYSINYILYWNKKDFIFVQWRKFFRTLLIMQKRKIMKILRYYGENDAKDAIFF